MNDIIATQIHRTLQKPHLEHFLGGSLTGDELEALDDLLYSQKVRAKSYIEAFGKWMDVWKPQFFVTLNLPNRKSAKNGVRDHAFYLGLWTRCAESELTGLKQLSRSAHSPRWVWMFRKEIKDGLVHYHGK